MKSKTFFSLILILCIGLSIQVQAQTQTYKTIAMPYGARVKTSNVEEGITTHTYGDSELRIINGTPYLDNSFKDGKIELTNGDIIPDLKMRYNMYEDFFEIKKMDDTLIVNKPYLLNIVFYQDKIFVYNPAVFVAAGGDNGYYERLESGKLNLYSKRKVDLKYDEFVPNYAGGSGTKEYYYRYNISYLLEMEANTILKISNKKQFLKNIPSHKTEMNDFIKKNRINMKEEKDLVSLIKYYNSIN